MSKQVSSTHNMDELRQQVDEAERESIFMRNILSALWSISNIVSTITPTLHTHPIYPDKAIAELRHGISRLHDVSWPLVENAYTLWESLEALKVKET